jgi:hypothetical protein
MSAPLPKSLSLLLTLWLTLLVVGNHSAVAEQCIQFPINEGPEEVCVDGALPAGPIHVGPGDAVSLPLVRYENHTDRDMRFRIEVGGSVVSTSFNSITLAPGEEVEITNLVFLKTDDYAEIGTAEVISVGWTAFGELPGELDYIVTVEAFPEFLVGPDSDGDGLVDSWEENGYDPDADGVIDIDLPQLGADPMHKDMFVEIDWEASIPPSRSSLQEVREAFAAAPIDAGGVANPDGLPGIDVHFDTGSLSDSIGLVGDPEFDGPLGRGTEIPDGPWTFGLICVGGLDDGRGCHPTDNPCDLDSAGDKLGDCSKTGFSQAKKTYFDFFPRRFVFRYIIMNTGAGAGQGELGGDDIWLGSRSSATLMHEIGHTLNLSHGGPRSENGIRNCEPNYLSIMNYRYGRLTRSNGLTHIDFSPAKLLSGGRAQVLADLDENALNEIALDPSDPDHIISFVGPPEVCSALCDGGGKRDGKRCAADGDCEDPDDSSLKGTCRGVAQEGGSCTSDAQCGGGACGGKRKTGTAGQPVDWNQNMTLGEVVPQNIDGTFQAGGCGNENFAAERTTLTSHDDWSNIRLRFRPSQAAEDAPEELAPEPELTDAEIVADLEAISTTDLEIVKTGTAGPLEAETVVSLEYDLVVTNAGPNFAGTVLVQDDLPSGFSVSALDDRCSEVFAGIVQCETEALMPNDEVSFSLEVQGTLACSGGLPSAVMNSATVENASEYAGDDPDPSDNSSSFETEVVDTTPPQLNVAVSPTVLAPPNHRLHEVTVTLSAQDACDDAPTIRLVSVTSNEPDNGIGDGDTFSDVQGADLGAADTSILLRAERSGIAGDRVYTLTYEAEDKSGNVTRVSQTVTVPRGNGK